MIRTLFVPLAPGLAGDPPLDAAVLLARRMHSHIRAMFVRPDPLSALSYLSSVMVTVNMEETIENEGKRAEEEEHRRFETWRSRQGIPVEPADTRLDTCFASWSSQIGEVEPIVTRYGRTSDMIVLKRFAPDDILAQRCFDAALFGSGRPTLLAPENLSANLLGHVLIAWNGSLEASHAVFGAMPLLHAADRVSVFTAPGAENDDTTGSELADALSWHGIYAHPTLVRQGSEPVGVSLLATAANSDATLIVMGAYTHSRLRQSFLGGVTRHVLLNTAIPVVMSH